MAYDKKHVEYLFSLPLTTDIVNELVKCNEGLIFKQLKKFGMYNDTDAISLAYEALFFAITTFDTTKNNAFSTYATVCIYNKLGSYLRAIKSKPDVLSYDAYLDDDTSFLSVLESGDTADANYLDKIGVVTVYQAVFKQYHIVKHPKQKEILDVWIDSNFKITLSEIAKRLGCSQSYVSKVINTFRAGLKNKLQIRR